MQYLWVLLFLFATPALVTAEVQPNNGTRINISATATTEIPNNEVAITFRIERQGKSADEIRQYVNRATAAIHRRLKHEKGLKLKTVSRNMQPVWHYPKNSPRVRSAWRMTQTEVITSDNLNTISTWLDAIEKEGAHLSNLQFRITPSSLKQTKEKLRLEAIRKFRTNAQTMAKGVDAKSYRILYLNGESQDPHPVLYRTEAAMAAKSSHASAPALSSGEGTVRITINGQIEVPYTDFPVK